MLKVEHLNKNLNGFALKDIAFYLPSGYIMGLIGENGAGKSTLMKTIMNIYEKNSGCVRVDGYSMDQEEIEAKNRIGAVLNENFFEEGFTVAENGRLFGRYFNDYDNNQFLQYCKRFELDPNKKLKKLSKGMQIKFQLAFALSHDAKLLLLDEPSANLDQSFRKELLQIMTEFVYSGERSILLSTHLTEELDLVADYITFLHKGNQIMSLPKEELLSRYQLVSGDDYKVSQLSKEQVVYVEKGKYSSKALIKKKRSVELDSSLEVENPTMDDIMYYMIKGGFANVETIS